VGVVAALARIDRSGLAVAVGLRCTVGVVVPLVVGILTGHVASGVDAGVGSLVVGFVSFEGRHRSTLKAMLIAAAGVTVSMLAGSLGGGHPVALLFVMAAWGIGAGLAGAFGSGTSVAALQAVVVLVVFSSLPMGLVDASAQAGWVLAGALLQCLLVVAAWPHRPIEAEREALAGVYRRLGAYARAVPAAAPASDQLAGGVDSLGDPNPAADPARLSALVWARHRLDESGDRAGIEQVNRQLEEAAEALQGIGDLLVADAGERALEPPPVDEGDLAPTMASRPTDAGALVVMQLARADALARRLVRPGPTRAASVLAARAVAAGRTRLSAAPGARRERRTGWIDPGTRRRLSERTVWAQSARLAGVLVVGTLLARLLHLADGYWIAMTAAVVVRGDFTGTLQRGAGRLLGTLVGSSLITILAALVTPGRTALVVAVVVLTWGTYSTFRANYGLYSVFLTSTVVVLLAIVGAPIVATARNRAIATAIGGALALAGFVVWPTWKRRLVPRALAVAVSTQGRYGAAVVMALASATPDLEELARLAGEARGARSELRTLLEGVAAEPGRRGELSQAAGAVEAQLGRCAHLGLSLNAQLLLGDARVPLQGVAPLAGQIAEMTTAQAAALTSSNGFCGPSSSPPPTDRSWSNRPSGGLELEALVEAFEALDPLVQGIVGAQGSGAPAAQ